MGKAELLCGAGAAGLQGSVALATIAERHDVKALLLPMPYFFHYQQEDLDAFCRAVALATMLPILLYNLPQFTSGLEADTVRKLISEVSNIFGIKDSSGSLEIMRDLTSHGMDACRIVGNGSALAPALIEGVCDGVVSGVACVLPELVLSLYPEGPQPHGDAFLQDVRTLNEFIAQLDPFPTPWGLKWAVEARGMIEATFSQPLSHSRKQQADSLAAWVSRWQNRASPQ